MRKIFLFVFSIYFLPAQVKTSDFPEGVYTTFKDFQNKTPSQAIEEYRVKVGADSIPYRFFSLQDEKKLNKTFALSYKNALYVNLKMIIKNFDKKSKGQTGGGNYFLKADNIGEYLFFKDYFVSNDAVILGGAIATSASKRVKGIVYLEKDKKFRLFKNLKTFKFFVKENYPNYDLEIINKEGGKEIEAVIKTLKELGN